MVIKIVSGSLENGKLKQIKVCNQVFYFISDVEKGL